MKYFLFPRPSSWAFPPAAPYAHPISSLPNPPFDHALLFLGTPRNRFFFSDFSHPPLLKSFSPRRSGWLNSALFPSETLPLIGAFLTVPLTPQLPVTCPALHLFLLPYSTLSSISFPTKHFFACFLKPSSVFFFGPSFPEGPFHCRL